MRYRRKTGAMPKGDEGLMMWQRLLGFLVMCLLAAPVVAQNGPLRLTIRSQVGRSSIERIKRCRKSPSVEKTEPKAA